MIQRALACVALLALLVVASTPVANAQAASRVAFVVGNAAYAKAPLSTSLNDAGLVAEALRSVGFDIVEGADLSQADFVRALREFLGRLDAAGPDATAFVYFSGYGFAYEGDNFLVAVDARLGGEYDIPLDAMRLSDVLRALDGSPARAKIIAIDAARRLPFGIASLTLASGFAALEAPRGLLIAYSAEPGTLIEDRAGPYGPYATALAEMIRSPGLNIVDAFPRMRVRTHQLTEGRQLPWNSSALGAPLVLVPPDPAAPSADLPAPLRRLRPMSELGPDEAYGLAIETDDLPAYAEYLDAYPSSPYAPRIWAAIRARREALAWMRAVDINSPQAYWTYLRRYPNGIYAADAARRLRRLSAPLAPPAGFLSMDFVGVPMPLAQEPPVIIPYYRSPPRPPLRLIEPPPALFANPGPPRRAGGRVLPISAPLPAVPRVPPGGRVNAASDPPNIATRPPPAAALTPTGSITPPRAVSRPGGLNMPAPVPTRTSPSGPRTGPTPGTTSALPSAQPRTFQPSRRQGDPPPGTYGISPNQATTFQPSRRQGQPATPAPSGVQPQAAAPPGVGPQIVVPSPSQPQAVAPAGGRPQTVAPARRQVVTTPSPGTPAVAKPAAPITHAPPQVSRPVPPRAPAISPPAAPQLASPPPPVARIAPPSPLPPPARQAAPPPSARQAAPAKKCTVENGQQVCR